MSRGDIRLRQRFCGGGRDGGVSVVNYGYIRPDQAQEFLWPWFIAGFTLACTGIAYQLHLAASPQHRRGGAHNVKKNAPGLGMRRFQNTCVVVTRGRRLVRTWAGGLDYAHMIAGWMAQSIFLTNRSRIWERDLFSLYESLFCQR